MSVFRCATVIALVFAVLSGCTSHLKTDADMNHTITFRDCSGCPEMVTIPAGSFLMGSLDSEVGHQSDEGPQHRVTISSDFAVGKFEVTVDEYLLFAQETGKGGHEWRMVGYPDGPVSESGGRYANFPVRRVSWIEVQDYVQWLSQRSGKQYRLLAEAEWEYVARGGRSTGNAMEPANTRQNLPADPYRDSLPVGILQPNAFGIYDMTGNASEWTADCYLPDYSTAPADGSAVGGACTKRVVRGGYSYGFNGQQNYIAEEFMRIANRDWGYGSAIEGGNATGFRVARFLP